MSRTQKIFVIIAAAVNLCGFIAWSMLMERIHSAPRQPHVATQQIMPLEYKGTTRFISPLDEKLLRWSGGPWPLVMVFGEFAVLVLLGVRNKSPERTCGE
jgi:hypothetical protein